MLLKNSHIQVLIVLLSAFLFIPFLGDVHLFDWDEINFAESAREMILTGNYLDVQIDFQAFWEKPPLFIWLQVLSMKVFGINALAARLPNALVGVVSLLVFFNIGNKLYNQRFGILWALVYAGSLLPFFYFKTGIIDPLFNLFIFLSIYQFFLFMHAKEKRQLRHVFLSAVFCGLGILTKGPVAFLIFGLTAFIYMVISSAYKTILNWKVLLTYAFTLAFVGGFWFILQLLNGNYSVIADFIAYQIRLFQIEDAGHGGFFGYHFVVLFFGVFPASVFAIRAMNFKVYGSSMQQDMKRWMMISFWVVLILFSIVNTKIVHYSSFCYFPLGFLATLSIHQILEKEIRFAGWMKGLLLFIAFLLGAVIASFRYVEKYKDKIIAGGYIKDDFAVGNLQANVHWPFMITLVGIGLFVWTLFLVLSKWQDKNKIVALFVGMLVFVEVTMVMVVPRIEQYSQNAAIEFYKEKASEDCYVEIFGFKSYAKYFYAQKQIPAQAENNTQAWYLSGKADKKVYIVCKNTAQEHFEKRYPHFQYLYGKNGFLFYAYKNPLEE